ncbi:MAG TPA: ATP-dependent RecD-like DNA helicase [Acetobacteraceae bacterium]|nr:ATP-dependent RecD-like DNA helicase [Acetobacteraceae bacterium]
MRGDAPRAEPASEFLTGTVERVTYHNAENGFCVLRVQARGRRDPVSLVGHAAAIAAGEFIQASGTWENDHRHGLQFRASFLKSVPPTSAEGIARYLGSGMIRGIGPVYARRLVQSFGADVLDIIDRAPARLAEVSGIGPKRQLRIREGWAEQKVVREIMLFLHGHGVSTARSVRIYKTYGAEAVRIITENPYRLARDIRGIGFASADTIAARLGIAKDAPIRIRAGIGHALTEAMDEGNCGLPREALLDLTARLIAVPRADVEAALAHELEEGAVIADTLAGAEAIFLAGLYRAEQEIAARLATLAAGALPWAPIDPEKAIPWVERKTGLALAASQRAAVSLALRSKLLVITGGPGVGKTTILDAILRILRAKDVPVLLAAPTGRAAKRLAESTGLEARTIHRLLEINPATGQFRRDASNPLACDLLVLDEASMVDVPIARSLLRAVPDGAAMLIVGDVDQIPSVGPGQVLADIIASGAVPVIRLQEVFRQAAESRIVRNAHRINQGLMPQTDMEGEESDFHFVSAGEPEEMLRKLIALVTERIPRRFGLDPVREIQVLCPMNRGGLGARALNLALKQALNPVPGGEGMTALGEMPSIERFGFTYSPGDKVMQVENDYERDVFNGDLGFVRALDAAESEVVVAFDGREVRYGFGELDELQLAYATTIHKAQGSEYPAVIIPLATQHYPMLARNLLYTGITRGKRLVVLLGQKRALAIAVRTEGARLRHSKLAEWLARPGGRANSRNGTNLEER